MMHSVMYYWLEHEPVRQVTPGRGTDIISPYSRDARPSDYYYSTSIARPYTGETHKRLWHPPEEAPQCGAEDTVTIVYYTDAADDKRLIQETVPQDIDWPAMVEECQLRRWCYFKDLVSKQPFIRELDR